MPLHICTLKQANSLYLTVLKNFLREQVCVLCYTKIIKLWLKDAYKPSKMMVYLGKYFLAKDVIFKLNKGTRRGANAHLLVNTVSLLLHRVCK